MATGPTLPGQAEKQVTGDMRVLAPPLPGPTTPSWEPTRRSPGCVCPGPSHTASPVMACGCCRIQGREFSLLLPGTRCCRSSSPRSRT